MPEWKDVRVEGADSLSREDWQDDRTKLPLVITSISV